MDRDFIRSLRNQYDNYSDEDLIELIQSERDAHSKAELKVMEDILRKRGYEIEFREEVIPDHEMTDQIESKMEEGQSLETIRLDMMDSKPLDRINELVESIEEDERGLANQGRTRYDQMSDEALIEAYSKKIEVINLTNGSGDNLSDASMDDLIKLSETIFEKRNLTLPKELEEGHIKALFMLNISANKALRRKGWRNLAIGLVIFLVGTILTLGSGGGMIFYGAIIVGFFQLISGIVIVVQTNNLPKMPNSKPPEHFRY